MTRRTNLRSKRKSKGLALPGYNNLGPFNDLNTPLSKSDAEALIHDVDYNKRGKRSYWTFNQADENFLNNIEKETDYGAQVAKGFFRAKKKLATWNLLPSDPLQSTLPENPLLDFHGVTGKGPLTRAKRKALEALRQTKITDAYKRQKRRVDRENIRTELKKRKVHKTDQPLLNLQEKTQVPFHMSGSGDGKGSGQPAGLKETPIDKVVDVERGVPSYQFASLPFINYWKDSKEKTTNVDFGFRMTSPYDCIWGVENIDANAGTGVENQTNLKSTDSVVNKAKWFDYYAGIYKYYSVISCKWSILFENLSNEPVWVHQMYITDTLPPVNATNTDMLHWNDCESHYVYPLAMFTEAGGVKAEQLVNGWNAEADESTTANDNFVGTALNSNRNHTLQLSGQYSPGDAKHEIRQDNEVENWTLVTTNPTLRELLLLRIKPETSRRNANSATDNGRTLRYKYTVQLEYLVEFKELKDGLRWPVQNQPLTITINNNAYTQEVTDE